MEYNNCDSDIEIDEIDEDDDYILFNEECKIEDPNFIIENRGNETERRPLERNIYDEEEYDDEEDEQYTSLDIQDKNLAILIDIENVSPYLIDKVFEIIQHNNISIRRAYGDWIKAGANWQEMLIKYAIVPRHYFNFAPGKNSSDIALVIEAMELLFTANLDGFCIVSSDSDFTHLVQKIRERGLRVYGFGRNGTLGILQNSCHQFFYIGHKLLQVKPEIFAELHKMFHLATLGVPVYNNGLIPLAVFGASLRKNNPNFDPKNYGYEKLADLAKSLPFVQIKEHDNSLFIKIY